MPAPDGAIHEFSMTTTVITGVGSLTRLPGEIARLNGQRVAVVADRGVADAGVLDQVLDRIDREVVAAMLLIDADPDVRAAEQAALAARSAHCDLVLAVGGGSALGAAKAVAIRLTNNRTIDAYEGTDQVENRPAPTIAVATTAGSGSEVSKVLVLHEPGRPNELVVRVTGGEPRVAILDAAVVRGLPREPMLYAGLDALSHSLEAQWSRGGSWYTDALSKAATAAILDLLPMAVAGAHDGSNRRGENDGVLQALLEASCAANMACGNSGLTLVHALSAAPTVHVPHGRQNGILLPHVARFNRAVSDADTRQLVSRLDALYRELDFPARYPADSLDSGSAPAMIAAATGSPLRANNKRETSNDQLLQILAEAGVPI